MEKGHGRECIRVTEEYLTTLLRYYEEEVEGEAYFYGLRDFFPVCDQQSKLELLAKVEHHSAASIRPLVDKYALVPRSTGELFRKGKSHVKPHRHWTWFELITYMSKRYPLYLEDFAYLESLAPEQDRAPLEFLTRHEVAVIEFAERELAGDSHSTQPLCAYLAEPPPA